MARFVLDNILSLTTWLHTSVPSFPVSGEQISIVYKPEEFYETLLHLCDKANKRIVLASLYLGTGVKEKRLVNVIRARSGKCPSLKVRILLDAIRGSRGEPDSRQILMPLLQNNTQTQVYLFHTPKLKGLLRSIMPARYNELIGLQHMKIYIIDDDVVISGANLSNDYFTNRQDRYVIVRDCLKLADFFDGLINILCDMSFQLSKSNSLSFPDRDYHPYEKSYVFINELHRRISTYYASFVNSNENIENNDTLIFPTIEIPPCGIHTDSDITKTFLNAIPNGASVYLASGYFNLTDELIDIILHSKADYNILSAHPTANGFFQSDGLSKYIPDMYTAISKHFYDKVQISSNGNRIKLFEFGKNDWTFHGKGIWVTFPNQSLPQVTFVGSSNFGIRSRTRDLESQLIIVTDNKSLKEKLQAEQRSLFDYGSALDKDVFQKEERQIPFWINNLLWFFKSFL